MGESHCWEEEVVDHKNSKGYQIVSEEEGAEVGERKTGKGCKQLTVCSVKVKEQ